MKKYLFIAILAGIAIVNAAYLSWEAYQIVYLNTDTARIFSICDINSTFSCTSALDSAYSRPFGIPFPFVALAVYPVLLLLALLGYIQRSYGYAKALAVLSFMGMCFNGYIIYMETFYIHAFCPLCLLCSAIIITIFITSLWILSEKKILPVRAI